MRSRNNQSGYNMSGLISIFGIVAVLIGLVMMVLLPEIRYSAWLMLLLGVQLNLLPISGMTSTHFDSLSFPAKVGDLLSHLFLPLLELFSCRRLGHTRQPAYESVVEAQNIEDRKGQCREHFEQTEGVAEQFLTSILGPRMGQGQAEDRKDRQGNDKHGDVMDGR